MRRYARGIGALVWGAVPLLVTVACGSEGHPAGPNGAVLAEPNKDPAALPGSEAVGPSPLRRLTNREYLHALGDLFPALELDLPPLPSDADVGGFENGAAGQAPSDVRVARYEAIANLYAEAATRDDDALRELLACHHDARAHDETCEDALFARVGRMIYRRPLASDERERLSLLFARVQRAVDFPAAVRLTLSTMLQAPQFLYRIEALPEAPPAGQVIPLDAYALATRLAFFLWQSTPDEELLDAAERGELQTEAHVRTQAKRMIQDARAKRVYWDFHRQWLGLDRVLEEEHELRTSAVDPSWDKARQAAVHAETRHFVEHVLSEGGTFLDLLLSRRAWVDAHTAEIYGLREIPEAGTETMLDGVERAGVLTRAAFLAGSSHRGATSPPVRANALQSRMLCRLPSPPPAGIDTTPPAARPDQAPRTNRELFEERTSPEACIGCHTPLNGLGFGFENYTASGAFTRRDNGLPVDATGFWLGDGARQDFDGAVTFSEQLSKSREAQHCAAQNWLRFALGRAPVDAESALIEALTDELGAGLDIPSLLVEIAAAPTFRLRIAGEE